MQQLGKRRGEESLTAKNIAIWDKGQLSSLLQRHREKVTFAYRKTERAGGCATATHHFEKKM